MKNPLVLLLLLTAPLVSQAEVQLAPIFRDHAVLQRDRAVPIWGRAAAGEEITVTFKDQTKQTKADDDGKWSVQLDPLPASRQAADLVVKGRNTLTVQDVLVGEVWFCSGQSNMAFHLQKTEGGKEAAKQANPLIRAYAVPRKVSTTPLDESAGQWLVASPETAKTMSGVAFYFARDLFQRLDVPIGIITSSWGGTFVESWIAPEKLATTSLSATINQRWEKMLADYPERKKQYDLDIVAWRKKAEAAEQAGKTFTTREPKVPEGPGHEDTPSGLFHAMVHPFLPYAIRGVLWYQGESNALRPSEYAELMKALIDGWRARFGQAEMSFYWVQLPKYGFATNFGWAELREAQTKTLGLKGTGEIVTVDLPLDDPKNKHPLDKLVIGQRLGRLAAGELYGAKEPHVSPRFLAMKREGAAVRVSFTDCAGGLTSKTAPLGGFEVAGADKIFRPAEAVIEKSEVIVRSPEVPEPVAVRYAFNDYPDAQLFSVEGLPVTPFRTDDWPVPQKGDN